MSWKSVKGATSAYTCTVSIEHKLTLECRKVKLADENTMVWQIVINGSAIAKGKKVIATHINKEKAKEIAHTWLEERLTDKLWQDLMPITSNQQQRNYIQALIRGERNGKAKKSIN